MTHEAFDQDAHKAFWQYPAEWPRDRLGGVFLGRAVHLLGTAMFGDEWTGQEPALAVDDEAEENAANWPAITRATRVQTEIARRCESGELASAVLLPSGKLGVIQPSHWAGGSYRGWFNLCQMDIEDPDLQSLRHRGTVKGALWKLFLNSPNLSAAIAAISEERALRAPRAPAPVWAAGATDTQLHWLTRPEVVAEAIGRLSPRERHNFAALSRALYAMWSESGRDDGGPGSFATTMRRGQLTSVSDVEEAARSSAR